MSQEAGKTLSEMQLVVSCDIFIMVVTIYTDVRVVVISMLI